MTTILELENIVEKLKIKNFSGIYFKDDLVGKQASNDECGIVNLNDSDVPIEENRRTGHWIGYFKRGPERYHFCSFGSPCPSELIKYLDKPIHTHNFCIQEFNTSICGELVCLWLYLMDRRVSYFDSVLSLQDYLT